MRIVSQGTYRLITGVLLTSMLLLLSALAPAQSEENAEVSRQRKGSSGEKASTTKSGT